MWEIDELNKPIRSDCPSQITAQDGRSSSSRCKITEPEIKISPPGKPWNTGLPVNIIFIKIVWGIREKGFGWPHNPTSGKL